MSDAADRYENLELGCRVRNSDAHVARAPYCVRAGVASARGTLAGVCGDGDAIVAWDNGSWSPRWAGLARA